MREFAKPELTPHSETGEGWCIYRGKSMLRLFVPGDLLSVEPLVAGKAGRGDVICFDAPPGKAIVHRVVSRTVNGGVVTMGDNNARPDVFILPPDHKVYRVILVRRLSGQVSPVYGGRRGMLIFRMNRLRRFFARLSSMAAGALRRLNPFRITLKNPVLFGDEEVFFFRGAPVAKRVPGKAAIWMSPWFRALFKVHDDAG